MLSVKLGLNKTFADLVNYNFVNFYTVNQSVAWVATGLLIPIMLIFIAFAAHFYLKLFTHNSEVYEDGIKELQLLKDQLEEGDVEGAAGGGKPGGGPGGTN